VVIASKLAHQKRYELYYWMELAAAIRETAEEPFQPSSISSFWSIAVQAAAHPLISRLLCAPALCAQS